MSVTETTPAALAALAGAVRGQAAGCRTARRAQLERHAALRWSGSAAGSYGRSVSARAAQLLGLAHELELLGRELDGAVPPAAEDFVPHRPLGPGDSGAAVARLAVVLGGLGLPAGRR